MLPDQLHSLPRLQELAYELRVPADELLTLLRNQGIYAKLDDRYPAQVVHDALQRELDAGRGWKPRTLVRYPAPH